MDEVLKATALTYFQEALINQEYEACKALVFHAKKCGAKPEEIKNVIAAALHGNRPKAQQEARLGKNRLSLLKENK